MSGMHVEQGDVQVTYIDALVKEPEFWVLAVGLRGELPEVTRYASGAYISVGEQDAGPEGRDTHIAFSDEVHGWGTVFDFADDDLLIVVLWKDGYKRERIPMWRPDER